MTSMLLAKYLLNSRRNWRGRDVSAPTLDLFCLEGQCPHKIHSLTQSTAHASPPVTRFCVSTSRGTAGGGGQLPPPLFAGEAKTCFPHQNFERSRVRNHTCFFKSLHDLEDWCCQNLHITIFSDQTTEEQWTLPSVSSCENWSISTLCSSWVWYNYISLTPSEMELYSKREPRWILLLPTSPTKYTQVNITYNSALVPAQWSLQ